MRGRKPELNWTDSLGQFTTTIDKVFHRLGTDKPKAEQEFRFLLNKADLGEVVDKNPVFAQVADQWLGHVRENHSPERYRLSRDRLQEFVEFVGDKLRVRDLRASHVERWIECKKEPTKKLRAKGGRETRVQALGTERGYKGSSSPPSTGPRGRRSASSPLTRSGGCWCCPRVPPVAARWCGRRRCTSGCYRRRTPPSRTWSASWP